MLSLLAVVDNPFQDIPLACVLKSPIIGMTEEELAWLMAVYNSIRKKQIWGQGTLRGSTPLAL